jgi:chaperone LolA
MSRSFLLPSLAALLLCAGSAPAQDLAPEEQTSLITKLQQKRAQTPALSAAFTEERISKLVQKPLVTSGTMSFQAPDKFRRDVAGDAPSTTVYNGQELWIYYPAFKEAEHYSLGQNKVVSDMIAALTAGLNFQDVDRFFRMKITKDPAGYHAVLTPKSGGLKKRVTTLTVYMDGEGTILKTDTALPEGERAVTTYKNVHATKQSDAKFDFTPPAGVSVKTPLGK